MGGGDVNKAALFACCLRMLFVPKWYFSPFQNILGSSFACSALLSALWPLWSYSDFHEVLEREWSCKLIPPLHSPSSQQGVDLNHNPEVLMSHFLHPSRTQWASRRKRCLIGQIIILVLTSKDEFTTHNSVLKTPSFTPRAQAASQFHEVCSTKHLLLCFKLKKLLKETEKSFRRV